MVRDGWDRPEAIDRCTELLHAEITTGDADGLRAGGERICVLDRTERSSGMRGAQFLLRRSYSISARSFSRWRWQSFCWLPRTWRFPPPLSSFFAASWRGPWPNTLHIALCCTPLRRGNMETITPTHESRSTESSGKYGSHSQLSTSQRRGLSGPA